MSLCSHKRSAYSRQIFVSWIVLIVFFLVPKVRSERNCAFNAMFVFGDSNSDTGGFFAAFPFQSSPYGMTYFKRPTGRQSDGRVYVDFLAQGLGLPFISPYLQSIGSNFKQGANFATSASTALMPTTSLFVNGVSPFYLAVQVNQMRQFKASVDAARGQQWNLPSPDIFGRALYTFYIGQNDFTGYLSSNGPGGANQNSPQIISQITTAIRDVYGLGGRTFFVLNLAPVGCYPRFVTALQPGSSDIDAAGCMISANNAVQQYNNMLREALRRLRQDLKDANVVYVDTYSVIYDLFQRPTSHGMQHGPTACCGYGGGRYNFNQQVYCGNTGQVDGQTVTAGACSDPWNYVSWDGIHLTENAQKMMAYAIVSGSYHEPAFNLRQYCDIQPIG